MRETDTAGATPSPPSPETSTDIAGLVERLSAVDKHDPHECYMAWPSVDVLLERASDMEVAFQALEQQVDVLQAMVREEQANVSRLTGERDAALARAAAAEGDNDRLAEQLADQTEETIQADERADALRAALEAARHRLCAIRDGTAYQPRVHAHAGAAEIDEALSLAPGGRSEGELSPGLAVANPAPDAAASLVPTGISRTLTVGLSPGQAQATRYPASPEPASGLGPTGGYHEQTEPPNDGCQS